MITKEKQKLYEKIFLEHENLQNNVPEICGYFGRACRQMNDKADRMLCNSCTLSVFISTVETILEVCNQKESIGIERLYDSDILTIQEKLEKRLIKVDISYIENILDSLTEE